MTMIWQDCNRSKGKTCLQTLTPWSQRATSLFTEDLHWSSATLTRHAHARGMGQTELQMPKFRATWVYVKTLTHTLLYLVTKHGLSPRYADSYRYFWLCKDVQQFQHAYVGFHRCILHMHAMSCVRHHRYLSWFTELCFCLLGPSCPQDTKHIELNHNWNISSLQQSKPSLSKQHEVSA